VEGPTAAESVAALRRIVQSVQNAATQLEPDRLEHAAALKPCRRIDPIGLLERTGNQAGVASQGGSPIRLAGHAGASRRAPWE